jgi:hypothetical protein
MQIRTDMDNREACRLTANTTPVGHISTVFLDAVGSRYWYSEVTLYTNWVRTHKTYLWGVGSTPDESIINLLCAVSGDETNRR